MAVPNNDELITCVSAEVYRMINQSESWAPSLFDEPEFVTCSYAQTWCSDIESVVYFIDFLVVNGGLRPYCLIMCLVYLDRFLFRNFYTLTQANWRPLVMMALLLSSKMWDDANMINIDCHEMFPHIASLSTVNKWEGLFLDLLQFDLNVSVGTYAKCYFRLYNKLRTVETREEFMSSRAGSPLSASIAVELDAVSNPSSRHGSPSSQTRYLAHTLEEYDLTKRPRGAGSRAVLN